MLEAQFKVVDTVIFSNNWIIVDTVIFSNTWIIL